jgi:hypothetical protein
LKKGDLRNFGDPLELPGRRFDAYRVEKAALGADRCAGSSDGFYYCWLYREIAWQHSNPYLGAALEDLPGVDQTGLAEIALLACEGFAFSGLVANRHPIDTGFTGDFDDSRPGSRAFFADCQPQLSIVANRLRSEIARGTEEEQATNKVGESLKGSSGHGVDSF